MCELSKNQMEWGMERLDIVAKNWGVSIEKAVQILSREISIISINGLMLVYFYQ